MMDIPNDNANWVFDDVLIGDISVPGGEFPSFNSNGGALWSSTPLTNNSPLRARPGSCSSLGSKACREKMRRDRLNDRFMELSTLLDPRRPQKIDKYAILADAVKMVNQLRDEAQKLRESNENLQEKINELKVEKNELRDEKQRLKTEKDNIEQQVKTLNAPPAGFLPHPSTIAAAPFSAPTQAIGSKLVPFVGYPGVPMWQLMSPTTLDTSQDPTLRPPAA